MKILAAILKRYNANTRDSNVGDCVKRSLSVAFRTDYDEVSRELNRIKRDIGGIAFNNLRVVDQFLSRRNITTTASWTTIQAGERPTVEVFADEHPIGTFLLLSGDPKEAQFHGRTNHMVCIVDGVIYDSWDSRNEVVVRFVKVNSSASVDDVDTLDDWIDEICRDLVEYISKLDAQCKPYLDVVPGFDGNDRTDKYTHEIYVWVKVLRGTEGPQRDWDTPYYVTGEEISHRIVIKWNPRLSSEANLVNIVKKSKQKIYDWVYMIRKDLKDHYDSLSTETNIQYRGSKSKLMTFPEWVRPLITYYRDNGNPEYEDKYAVYIDALPDDPRADSSPEVYFRGDTLREIKDQIADYKDRFLRPDYDY